MKTQKRLVNFAPLSIDFTEITNHFQVLGAAHKLFARGPIRPTDEEIIAFDDLATSQDYAWLYKCFTDATGVKVIK